MNDFSFYLLKLCAAVTCTKLSDVACQHQKFWIGKKVVFRICHFIRVDLYANQDSLCQHSLFCRVIFRLYLATIIALCSSQGFLSSRGSCIAVVCGLILWEQLPHHFSLQSPWSQFGEASSLLLSLSGQPVSLSERSSKPALSVKFLKRLSN